ncbi:MAG: hypothetical protein JNM84_22330 [Planctomycetes bacterium]|nr:hypothetical protein [Planctomycetota bacterium]
MFSRIVKLIEARRALRSGRLHEALALSDEASIREDRRAREIREAAREQLLRRAEERRSRGELSGALLDLRCVLAKAPEDDRRGRDLLEALRAAIGERDEMRELERVALEEARVQLARGWLHEARVRLTPHTGSSEAAARLSREIDARLALADSELDLADAALRRGEAEAAREALQRLRAIARHHAGATRIERELRRLELAGVLARARTARDDDELEQVFEELGARCAEHPELEDGPEFAEVQARLRERRVARLRTELLHGDPAAIGAAARRWHHLERASGEELPSELAGAVEALAEAVSWAELGVVRAPQLRLRRASGGSEVESALLQVGAKLQRSARELAAFGELGREAIARSDREAWTNACAAALGACPSSRALSELLAAANTRSSRAMDASAELERGHALAALLCALEQGPAQREVALVAWERLERSRAEAETVLGSLAQGSFDAAEAARFAPRAAALEALAKDSPWLALARRAVEVGLSMEAGHSGVRAALGTGDFAAAERALAAAAEAVAAREAQGCEPAFAALVLRRIERDLRALARAVSAAHERSGWSPLLAWLGAPPPAPPGSIVVELRARWSARLERERSHLRAECERRRAAGEALAHAEWERARLLIPGDPVLEELRDRRAEHAVLDARVRRAEWLSDRRDFSGAWDELRSIEDAGPFRTRIFDLKRRVQRERGLGQRFFLRVEEGGEYLVLLADRVRIGNARVAGNDLPILANISSHHAEIERGSSFHSGTRYLVKPIEARPVTLRDALVAPEGQTLRDGDVLRFGASLEMSFHLPSSRSQSAVLRLRDGFDVQGVERVILMKPGGKSGRLVCGPEERSHLRFPRTLDLELWIDDEGQLRGRSGAPWKIDGHAIEAAEPVLPAGAWVESNGMRFAIDPG